jgi:hypothetical protein
MSDTPSVRESRNETEDVVANQHELDLSEFISFVQDDDVAASQALPSLPATAKKALIYVEGQAVRWRPDGATTAPTASVGMVMAVGSTTLLSWGQSALAAVRIIGVAAGAKVNVVYYR